MKMNSNELFDLSKKLVPGGVHSPVRSFKGLKSTPRFIEKAQGAMCFDVDGKSYIDFCMSFGPLILGHQNELVKKSLTSALENGWSYGACEPYSVNLAEYLLDKISFIDQIRFTNSGTEAVMAAIRLARGATGRSKIIKFDGCYHGHLDSMLIKAGSGLAGTAEASSAGVPAGVSEDTLILDLNDKEALIECFNQYKDEIAAIIVEPLPANNGLLIQEQSYLEFLREITADNGSVLIFDEVISGFRVGIDGMAGYTGITPDLVTYGKVIGGGLPVGAVAGKREIMEHLAPVGPVYQAGTLSANPLAMVGGLTTLAQMDEEAYKTIEENTLAIKAIMSEWFENYNNGQFCDYKIITHSSLFWITKKEGITKASEIPADLLETFTPLFETLLEKGVYLAPNAYEVGFVSLSHDKDIQEELRKRLWE